MASSIKVHATWNQREFDQTMRRYVPLSKKDPGQICNDKALFIARGALRETEKRTRDEIREQLMAPSRAGGPIAALIVNKMRAAQGLPGLFGPKMAKAVEQLIKSRKLASLAAGWIGAIKQLTPLASRGGPPTDRSVKPVGQPKGYAAPAREGFKASAKIVNDMTAKWDTRGTALAHAMPGLEKAFANEERSMREYIERKMKETAQRAGIKTK